MHRMKRIIVFFWISIVLACNSQPELNIYSSLDSALSDSKTNNNKILLVFDFLGNPTVSAQKLLFDKSISSELNSMAVVLLNVDEPGKIGEKNKEIQINRFGTSTQPTFYILDNKGEVLKGPLRYCKKTEFLEFIK